MCLRDFGCVREGCGFKRRNNICFPYDLSFQLVYVIFGNTLYLDCLEMAYIRAWVLLMSQILVTHLTKS